MMKIKVLAMMLSGLILAACNGQPSQQNQPAEKAASSAVVVPASEPATSSEVAAASQVASSEFVDKMGDANFLPEGIDAKDVMSLKYNEKDDITVYKVKHEHKNGDVHKIYEQLSETLKKEQSYFKEWQASILDIQNKQVAYFFQQINPNSKTMEVVLNESCILNIQTEYVENICAISSKADTDVLKQVIDKEMKK